MKNKLANKVIVVTGGTRGLGLAIAQACVAGGAAVIITSRTSTAVDEVVSSIRARGGQAAGIPCDVANAAQVQAVKDMALQTFGRLDVWFNNAGLSAPYGPTLGVPPERFLRVVQTNIIGTYNGSLVALQQFVTQGHGKLINIYGAGDTKVRPFQNAYGSSKSWVRSFTETLAKEYKDAGVEIIGYNPGLVMTDMLNSVEAVAGYEEAVMPLATVVRLWGNPPEIPARKAAWLASAATDGRNGLVVRQLTMFAMLKGILQEGWRRLLGRPPAPFALSVETV
ncbi:MAG: SDR family oxidoreductase [Caldilineaceae bacterium]|jgi:NAD(P)-dependent dehydrogenase (short-subunit alcohol dehydrogenase family)|nr:SDR family oxidoreductase [Caldilineaceae bacterium]